MAQPRSIRRHLILSLAVGVIALELIAGAGLYAYVGETLERSLDATIAAKAEAVAAMVHMEEDNQPHLHIPEQYISQFSGKEGAILFQVVRADGRILTRSPSLGDATLTGPRGKRRFSDVRLPDGSEGRVTRLLFTPQPDEEHEGQTSRAAPPEQLQLLLARDTRAIDQPMAILLSGLLLGALLVTGGVIAIVTVSVRRGLRPLESIARESDRIGPEALQVRFQPDMVPAELQPICRKLNELLDRLHAAFIRERRFSADVAHELRTPIAELRSLCEVSLRWPGDASAAAESFGEALSISRQMEAIVTTLLTLVRSQAGAQVAMNNCVNLKEMIDSIAAPLLQTGDHSGVSLKQGVPGDSNVRTDQVMLSIILRNLLSNAVEYSPAGGEVRVAAAPTPNGLVLTISNLTSALNSADLPHLFEPFWRKDSSRTGGLHAGLGLAMVAAYCGTLGFKIETSLTPHEDQSAWFEVRITIPPGRLVATAPSTDQGAAPLSQ